MGKIHRGLRRGSLLLLFLVAPVLLDPGAQARAQACTRELSSADQAYTFGRFDEAITLLNQCLKKRNLVRIEQQQSRRLLALSYIGKADPGSARVAVRALVTEDPDYQPDPEQDPPPFVQMIEEIQREVKQDAARLQREENKKADTRLDEQVAQAHAFYEAGNYRAALPLYQEAAEKGHAGGQYGLGLMYREGRVVDHIDAEAMKWFRKAAEQGHAEAQFYVGWLYWKGQGAEQNDEEAATWYCKAAAQGHERARNALDRLNREC